MKKILSAWLVLSLALTLSGTAAETPNVTIVAKDTNRELAESFATAFSRLKLVPVHLTLTREGKTVVLADVRRVTAVGSTLVVENGRGQTYVVNPADIVWISDSAADRPETMTR